MTEQEAINVFKGFKLLPREQRAIDMAIKSLEKQIPKKPKRIGVSDTYAICPVCYGTLLVFDYCPYCGQAIKWEGNEE